MSDDFFKSEDFYCQHFDEDDEKDAARLANSKRDKALEEAVKICKKGSGFGIDECTKWLEKWGYK